MRGEERLALAVEAHRARRPIGCEPFDLAKTLGARVRPQGIEAGRQVFDDGRDVDRHPLRPGFSTPSRRCCG
jgi:hypothetical protein